MSFPKPFYKWRPHPWHGLEIGDDPPSLINAFIEICPFDLVKYEVDKSTGYLRVDRPHRTSSQHPTLYGFIPRTFCGNRVGQLMGAPQGGDGDPLDICVISERPIARSEILLSARVIGGLPMLDGGQADDKIIAVLDKDPIWSDAQNLDDVPPALVERLKHYFLTYKLAPEDAGDVKIGDAYDREHATAVVQASVQDYQDEFGSD